MSLLTTVMVWLAAVSGGSEEMQFREGDMPSAPTGQGIYCQSPPPFGSINASTGYGSEVADDIPTELAASVFN